MYANVCGVVQHCYNLGNSWPNAISSLSVPRGHGCIFYNRNNCPQHGTRESPFHTILYHPVSPPPVLTNCV